MPIALMVIGLIMVITGVKNTHKEFGEQLKADFTGPGNFTYWLVSIGAIGALGYSKTLRPFSHGFLALIFIVLILKNDGVFDKVKGALGAGPVANPPQQGAEIPVSGDQKTAGMNGDDVASYAMIAATAFGFPVL